jgi:phage terminase small subunit
MDAVQNAPKTAFIEPATIYFGPQLPEISPSPSRTRISTNPREIAGKRPHSRQTKGKPLMTEPQPYTVPAPPPPLHKTGRDAWVEFCTDLELEDLDDLKLLELACSALDRAAQAARTLRDEGTYWRDRLDNLRPHPALQVEHKARAQAAQIIGQLQRSQLAFQRYELAAERHAEVQRKATETQRRSGGGTRRFG